MKAGEASRTKILLHRLFCAPSTRRLMSVRHRVRPVRSYRPKMIGDYHLSIVISNQSTSSQPASLCLRLSREQKRPTCAPIQ